MFKTSFTLTFLIFASLAFAQNKVLRPKKGEIVFISEETIKDRKLFAQSYKDMAKNMVSELKTLVSEEKEKNNEILDTLKLNLALDTLGWELPDLMANTKAKSAHHYVYRDSLIKYYITQNNVIMGDFLTLINPTNSTFVLQAKFNGQQIDANPVEFQYSKTRDSSIIEFRNEKKIINGFNCFKVIYKYKQLHKEAGEEVSDSEKEFLVFMSDFIYYKEFWVTEEIQSLFHPVCKDKEILARFYPLEIREYNDLIKGLEHTYILKSISLTN